MQKILIITDNTLDQINGVVTTYKNIAKEALLNNFEIIFLGPEQFKHISIPNYKEIKLSFAFDIGCKIKKINPDYIHIATEGPIGLASKIYLDKNNIRYNTSYHTKFPEAVEEFLHIPQSIVWKYIRWFHKHSGKVLTTTNTMCQELKENNLDADIIPWTRGVDTSIFYPNFNRESNDKVILLCVSRLSKEKNLDAFCRLIYPNSKKILVGDGPYKKELQEKYKDVEFVGFKVGNELAEYYRNADIFVFPSKWDTFGIVMIEALASGLPIAAYPVTGPKDIVEPGVNGYLSDSLSYAISCCLTLEKQKIFESSKKWIWKNTWDIFKNNLVRVK